VKLHGEIIEINALTSEMVKAMYALMDEFYDQVTPTAFERDLGEKDYSIMLYDENNTLQGFSTQKLMQIAVGSKKIAGVFSGDTIIHKDYWGSLALFKVFVQYFFAYGERYPEFYWFLISKGYKTYRILPVIFKEFYPRVNVETPAFEQAIMHSFGKTKYPREYDETSGVIKYQTVKDRLKDGVAEITEKQLRDKDIQFFLQRNPEYYKGNDLVCLTKLCVDNLRPTARRLLWGK
jgi:hypothetical protein